MSEGKNDHGTPSSESRELNGGFGEITVERQEDGTFVIIRADPRVQINRDYFTPGLWAGHFGALLDIGRDRLVITGTNARYVYRITGYNPVTGCYEAQWAD